MYRYIIPAILLALPLATNAQGKAKKIKCTVTNEEGKPMKGVTAIEHGTDDTLVTAANGVFTISVSELVQVAVSAPGYHEEHILVSPDVKCQAQLRRDEDAEPDGADDEE
ncbi:MAG TPA: carboxypeptidase-like regulatory domain-containing protein [Flavipsychrobacter sp.]